MFKETDDFEYRPWFLLIDSHAPGLQLYAG